MARQPEASGRIQQFMWIGFALTEALAPHRLHRAVRLLLTMLDQGRWGPCP